ncbi:MAG: TIR domain-containing protein [Acidimicrobiales bacterium]
MFFSHTSSDKPLLRELNGYLPRWISSWIDEDHLLLGAGLESALRNAVDVESDFVVLFLSKTSAASEWVQKEVAWALEREEALGRVFLLVVLLEDVGEELHLLGLGDRIHVRLANHNVDGIELLARTLADNLGSWLSETASTLKGQLGAKAHTTDELAISIQGALASTPFDWRDEVDTILVRPFLQSLRSAQIGRVPLSPEVYYQRILHDMGNAGTGWTITAVSTLTSKLWDGDVDQTRYAERNLAAVARGATLCRIFVVAEGSQEQYRSMIAAQTAADIDVRIGTSVLFSDVPELEDFVLFKAPDFTRAYLARPTIDGSRRIASGRLVLASDGISRLDTMFATAWELALEPAVAFPAVPPAKAVGRRESGPPGTRMTPRWLPHPVITCEEAAAARGIPLAHELKTLLLQTSHGPVAAHLPGDGTLSLRKVKDRLESAEAYLVDPEDLLALGLSAGTVSAVLDPVWSMPHLISRRLLHLPEVMTNNGSRNGYFTFDPALLTEASDVVVDDFEK